MSNYEETHIIRIDDDRKIIKFERNVKRSECNHGNIRISEQDSEVLCLDCNMKLDPVHFIATHLKQLNQCNERNNSMLSEAKEIWKKLDKKNKFMCQNCHEVNTIDFRKLPSQAAITRGIAVIDEEFEGMRVEL